MDDRKFRFGVGVLVLAAVGLGVILTFFFGAFPTLLTRNYALTARFPSAPGVGIDTPVLKNGVRVGRVTSIRLLSADGVELTMEVEQAYPLQAGEVPRISTGSLITGDAVVEFLQPSEEQLVSLFDGRADTPPDGRLDPAERRLAMKPIADGDYISTGTVAGDPLQVLVDLEGDVRNTLVAVREAGEAVNGLSTDMRSFLGDGQGRFQQISEKTETALDEFRITLVEIRGLLADPELREKLKDSLDRFPVVLDEAQRTLQTTQRTLESFERVGRTAERTVQNVERFTEPLAERGDELVEGVLASLQNVDAALERFSGFGDAFGNSEGTLRRLMEDDELYWQIRRVVDNAEEASRQVQPILHDVRIFTDKIARDPRQLGIKGALDPRPTGLGLK